LKRDFLFREAVVKIEVRGRAPIGSRLTLDDQEYLLVRHDPYQRVGGELTTVMVWASACPKCGGAFETVLAGMGRSPARRCEPCRTIMGHSKVKPGRVNAVLMLADARKDGE
jgi:hypothetical protein